MKFLRVLLLDLIAILRILAYEWFVGLRVLLRTLCALFRRWRTEQKVPERQRRVAKERCVKIKESAYKRPDPLIYSQYYLMNLGLAVTWDNPDIELRKNGIPVSSSLLERNTEYDIVARIWNNSTEAPIVGLPVKFSYLSFGTGTTTHTIGQTTTNLGVKGGPNHPAFASVKWITPDEEGHYCLQVLLDWLDDANPGNNLGQENTDVGEMHSAAEFTFKLRNAIRVPQVFHFEVDSYRIPDPLPCEQREGKETEGVAMTALGRERAVGVLPQHDRRSHPIPPGWSVEIEPPEPRLEAGEEQTIRVRIVGPDGYKGLQPFNVHAFHQDGFVGGVTLYVEGK